MEEVRRALGKRRLIEELQKGAIVEGYSWKGAMVFSIHQENAPPLSVRYDSARSLERDGLLRSTATSRWAMIYRLVPTEKFWLMYPKTGGDK